MDEKVSSNDLKELFTKHYGESAPSNETWSKFYDQNVIFVDPTQERIGLNEYINAQNKLVKRCDDIFLEAHTIAISGSIGFVEWTMGLKIMGKEFIYPGTTRLVFGDNGKIINHRDYFDFCGPTFGPVPILGSITRWIYSKFVD
tara:strand:- start:81 stop:512 length:432 start_codon:yes stop_codon:yes gene_type:complete